MEQRQEAGGNDDVLMFPRRMDTQQKYHEEREANKGGRVADRNSLLSQVLDVLTKSTGNGSLIH
jgi:hypothetical protein